MTPAKRFERRARTERKELRLNPRLARIITHVSCCRYLTLNQILELEFKPTTRSWAKDYLRKLFDAGYLRKRGNVPHWEPDIYYNGLEARNWLAKTYKLDKEWLKKIGGVPGGNEPPMTHDLTVSWLYVRAVLECRLRQWEMRFKSTRVLELEGLGVQPDAHLTVETPSGIHEAYIEYSDQLPDQTEMKKKLDGYRALWEKTGEGIPVLWFTSNDKKATRVVRWLSDFVYKDYVLVGDVGSAPRFLTARMWNWQGETVSWIKSEQVLFES